MASQMSSLDQHDDQHDVGSARADLLKIVLALPVPDEHVPWEEIIEYRNDREFQKQFLVLRNCLSEIARGSLAPAQIEETLEYLLNRCRAQMELHEIKPDTTRVEMFVVSPTEVAAKLGGFGWSKTATSLFAFEHRKLELLEGESTTPGSEVAYVMDARPMS